MVEVIGVRHVFEKPAALVERDFCLPAVSDARPGFGFLCGELDSDGVMWSCFDPGMCRSDDAVVIPGRQGDPGPDLVRPCLDLRMIGFLAEGQCCLTCRLGGLAVTGVVFDACDQQGDPA